MSPTSPSRIPNIPPANLPDPEEAVLQAIRDTTFGTIEVTVHQSRIVQIVRSEKTRFEQR
jgi:hypothetical protein